MGLLKILAILGRGDQTSSEGMYEVLADVMKRADTGINVGYAIGILFCIFLTIIYVRIHSLRMCSHCHNNIS